MPAEQDAHPPGCGCLVADSPYGPQCVRALEAHQAGPSLKDSRDYALVVLVDHNGVADAQANGVAHKQAAEWLRHIADLWDPPERSEAAPVAPLEAPGE